MLITLLQEVFTTRVDSHAQQAQYQTLQLIIERPLAATLWSVSGVTCGRSDRVTRAPALARAMPTMPAGMMGSVEQEIFLHTIYLQERHGQGIGNALQLARARSLVEGNILPLLLRRTSNFATCTIKLRPRPVPVPRSRTLTPVHSPKGECWMRKSASRNPLCHTTFPTFCSCALAAASSAALRAATGLSL